MKVRSEYKPTHIEKKWQKNWEDGKTFSLDINSSKNPYYCLMMFPYPSAEGLHVGNMYAFTGADVYARYQRMKGLDVFEPIGLDGFGIHSENFALKVGKNPKELSKISEKNFYRQLREIGNSFDLTRTLETYDPDYYKWTQWIFITLFKNGLAYRKKSSVNWCPSCKTVLSDEQVINGECERCGTRVTKKDLEQWFFKITKYAQKLLDNIENLDWSKKVKVAQTNWIGRSEGARVVFRLQTTDYGQTVDGRLKTVDRVEVFTTRPDTLFGATFMVISPEHKLVSELLESRIKNQESRIDEIRKYIEQAKMKTEQERVAEGKEKTGVFSGVYAINPVNSEKIPVWIADYVLASYGTGAIMAVPAHDQRDFEFAKKYDLPIREVIRGKGVRVRGKVERGKGEKLSQAYTGDGEIVNSGDWNGLRVPSEVSKVIDFLEKKKVGKREVNFHLRDWLISRQRYWGPPIPVIYCHKCWENTRHETRDTRHGIRDTRHGIRDTGHETRDTGYKEGVDFAIFEGKEYSIVPVPEKDLPVLLPDVSDWKPKGTGKSPLASVSEFYEVECPSCGSSAMRETDVSDTFLDSAWYFLRYLATDLADVPFPSKKFTNSKHEAPHFVKTTRGRRNSKQTTNLNIQNPKKFRDSKDKFRYSKVETRLPDGQVRNFAQRARWLPVDMYIGGAEHSVLHLLYSRFITMALSDLGFLDFEEPYKRFFAHGLIIKDGAKMSKSRGNVVVPDEYIKKYGADALRMYLMFIGPYESGGDFSDSSLTGVFKFLKRVWTLLVGVEVSEKEDEEVERYLNIVIKDVTKSVERFSYNTAIARLMELYNFVSKKKQLSSDTIEAFLKMLAPFAPHLTEELWQELIKGEGERVKGKGFESIHLESWPEFEESFLKSKKVTFVVQVNGKLRDRLLVEAGIDQKGAEKLALASVKVQKFLGSNKIRKVVFVSDRLINFVS